MTVAEATPDLEQVDRHDRAFLGHPKGLGFLGFTEACERFSYYSMQTLLVLYMVNYLLLPGRMFIANAVVGYVGGLYSTLPTTTFWLIHAASAAFGLVAFAVFKIAIGKRMESTPRDQAAALS